MSYQTTLLQQCETLQRRLVDVWKESGTAGADENMPFAEWVAMQMAAIQQEILPEQSKRREVRVTYFPRITEDQVTDDGDNPLCESSTKRGNLSTTYDAPDTYVTADELIDLDDLETFCEDNGTYFMSRLAALLDVLERKIATQWSTEAVLLAGTWGDLGVAGQLFAPGNSAGEVNANDEYVWQTRVGGSSLTPAPVLPEAWWDLRFAMNKMGNNQPAMFGGSEAYRYFGATQVGCCGDRGIDLRAALEAYGYAYAYDKRLADALASENKFMSFEPNSIVPLWHVKGRWKDGVPAPYTNNGGFTGMIVNMRRFGIPVDVIINQPCGTEVTLAVSVATKLISLPTDQFLTNDVYSGKTGVNKVLITNP